MMFPFYNNHTPLKKVFLKEGMDTVQPVKYTALNKVVSKEKRYLMPQQESGTLKDVKKNSIIQQLNKNATVRPIEEEILYSWYLIQNDADIIRNVTRLKQSDKFLLENLALQHLPFNNITKKENVTYESEKNKDKVKIIYPPVSDSPSPQKHEETHSGLRLNSLKSLNLHSNISAGEIKNTSFFHNNQKNNNVSSYRQNLLRNSVEDIMDIAIANNTETPSNSQIHKKSSEIELNVLQKHPQLSSDKSVLQTPLPRQQYEGLSHTNNTIKLQYESTPTNPSIKLNSLLLIPYNQSENTQLYLLQILPQVNVSTVPHLKEIKKPLQPSLNDKVQVNTTVFQPFGIKSSNNLSNNNSLFFDFMKPTQHSITESPLTLVKSVSGSKLRQSTSVTQKDDYKKQYILLVVCIVLISATILLLCGFLQLKLLGKREKPSPPLKRTKTFILSEKKKVHFSDDSIPSCTTNDTLEIESDESPYAKKTNKFCETPTINLNIESLADTNQTRISQNDCMCEMIPFNIKPPDFHSSNNLQNSSLFTMSRCKRPFSAIQK